MKKDIVKLSLVGVGMATNFGVAAKVFSTLKSNNIAFYTISTSEISISTTIHKNDKQNAVTAIARAFEL